LKGEVDALNLSSIPSSPHFQRLHPSTHAARIRGWRLEFRSGSSIRPQVPSAGLLFAQGESNMSNTSRLTGVAIAAAAATLFIAGCANMGGGTQTADSGAVKVKCYGANACKGQAECKTGMNNCKGQNACKGQGFMSMSEKACVERLGRT